MKYVIKQSDAIVTQENNASTFHEYPFTFNKVSLGVSEINGRYPDSGYEMDSEIEQYYYVESGQGIICIDQEKNEIEKGDMVYIPRETKYWIEGKSLKLIVCSTPAWYKEQHRHIE